MDRRSNSSQQDSLQHEGKMPLKERIEQSQAYGEKYRAEHSGPDTREAVHDDSRQNSRPAKPNPNLADGDTTQESSGGL